jgi:hypothetical protein
MKDNLLVFALILIVSILFFSGCFDSAKDAVDASSPVVNVIAQNQIIKLTLVEGGKDIPSFGYSLKDSVEIRLNGTILSDDNLSGNVGWEVNESLYIGGWTPVLDDEEQIVDKLAPGYYLITVRILEVVIFDDEISVAK